jgi:predicted RNA binding protein YcfA (HicA-like mRNA interferase family)
MGSDEVIRRLKADGWLLERTRGSHHQFAHPLKKGIVTVPHPRKDLPIGTLKRIAEQAGLRLG